MTGSRPKSYMWNFRSDYGSYQNLSSRRTWSLSSPQRPHGHSTLKLTGQSFKVPGLGSSVHLYSKSRYHCIWLEVSYVEAIVLLKRLLNKGICLFTFSTWTQSFLVLPVLITYWFLFCLWVHIQYSWQKFLLIRGFTWHPFLGGSPGKSWNAGR